MEVWALFSTYKTIARKMPRNIHNTMKDSVLVIFFRVTTDPSLSLLLLKGGFEVSGFSMFGESGCLKFVCRMGGFLFIWSRED